MKTVKILGIAGSLRKESYNRSALLAAGQLLPAACTLESCDLDGLPLFNQDLEQQPNETITNLKNRIRAADAILFVTPEYNYSIPGVLKNAIDCASRPYGDNAWKGKPAALMGASVGIFGSARAQYHLRQILVFLDMPVVNQPEVMIGNAADRFNTQGELIDGKARELIRKLLEELAALARRNT
jgi:chromate reductase, NAD(P)H dehydrogenase (quinone)